MIRLRFGLLLLVVLLPPQLLRAQSWEDWYLHSNGSHLYVTEIGRGDTVVVLHGGWGGEHSYLLDAIAGLESDFHFVLYDQRGSLRSPSTDSLISLDQHVADLEALRETLGLDRMMIMAHSMGTFLAMSYLDRYPDRVAGLTLAAAIPAHMDGLAIHPEAIAFTERPAVNEQISNEGLDVDRIANSKEDSKIWKIRFAAANIYRVERWPQLKGGRIFYSEPANEATTRSMPDSWNFTSRLREHPYQITVVLGDHDFADWKGTQWTATAGDLRNVKLVMLEEAGHNAWIDRPTRFAEVLRNALSDGRHPMDATE